MLYIPPVRDSRHTRIQRLILVMYDHYVLGTEYLSLVSHGNLSPPESWAHKQPVER